MLVLSVGFYGAVTNEQYFRAVGHWPWLYDYLFWIALTVNGLSGLIADYLSRLYKPAYHPLEWQYLAQYLLWLLLLPPQWRLYRIVSTWCSGEAGRKAILYVVADSHLPKKPR
jgi:hypothetical protein